MAGTLEWLRRHLEAATFALGVMVLIFIGGMVVGRAGLFPYPVFNAAWDAVQDWRDNWKHYLGLTSKYAWPTALTAGGVTVHDAALAFDGYTLVAAYIKDRYDAYLIDMDGNILNHWNARASRVWPDSDAVPAAGWDGSVEIHGAHLYDNGDLLVSLGGAGAAKLDRCGNVLWTIERYTHHHVEPLPDGGAFIPAGVRRHERRPDRLPIDVGPSGFYLDDVLVRVDRDGRQLGEKSVIDILLDAGWASVLLSGPGSDKAVREEDPIHLNDVEVLPAELAPAFPMFAAGDLMLSLRHPNTIFVVDPTDWRVKWVMTGPFLAQHDPDFLPNGHILVYDNRITGPTPRLGNSRLVEIDPATRQVVWTFEGEGGHAFYAHSRGEQQFLPNGNILFVDPYGGRLLEIAPHASKKIVWEWVNLIEPGSVGMITDVQRVPREAVDWVSQPCSGQ
jgi:hypothetical protein